MSNDSQFRERAEQIERLTARVQAVADAESRAPALELVQAVLQLHADALERLLDRIYEEPEGSSILDKVAEDPLISGVLLLYGLHPASLEERVVRSLENVRPYLQSHGGNVDLLEIAGTTVHLQLTGSCQSCPSSSATLKQAVERAIYEMAPDVTAVIAEQAAAAEPASQLVQLS